MHNRLKHLKVGGNTTLFIGMEQIVGSSNGTNNWYYTTPKGADGLATYLPWATGNPVSTASGTNNAMTIVDGYPLSFSNVECASCGFICQYGKFTEIFSWYLAKFSLSNS